MSTCYYPIAFYGRKFRSLEEAKAFMDAKAKKPLDVMHMEVFMDDAETHELVLQGIQYECYALGFPIELGEGIEDQIDNWYGTFEDELGENGPSTHMAVYVC